MCQRLAPSSDLFITRNRTCEPLEIGFYILDHWVGSCYMLICDRIKKQRKGTTKLSQQNPGKVEGIDA